MPAATTGSSFVHYRAICERAWDGDQWGNEWRMSWAVIRHEDIDGQPWAVYSDDSVSLAGELTNGDDGAGNGDYCGSFGDFDAACRHADALAAQADERASWGCVG